MHVNFYPDSLRFAGVIPKNPICSYYIVRCLYAMHVQEPTYQLST